MDQPDNALVLTGRLLKTAEVRSTPAGIPIARFVLAHSSRRSEAGQQREVECRIGVVAIGESLASVVASRPAGTLLKVQGFLSRAGYRAPDMRIELHALEIQAVADNG
jgi:primosomal replication protein N